MLGRMRMAYTDWTSLVNLRWQRDSEIDHETDFDLDGGCQPLCKLLGCPVYETYTEWLESSYSVPDWTGDLAGQPGR